MGGGLWVVGDGRWWQVAGGWGNVRPALRIVRIPSGSCSPRRWHGCGLCCDQLALFVLEATAALGHEPCFLFGDFNFDPLPAQALAMLAISGWVDVAAGLGPTTESGPGTV